MSGRSEGAVYASISPGIKSGFSFPAPHRNRNEVGRSTRAAQLGHQCHRDALQHTHPRPSEAG